MYKPKNFILEELVPEDVFNKRGERAWELLNPLMLMSLQELREYIGKPCRVNDWKWEGRRQNQCFRTSDYYSRISFSQHLLGNAVDPYFDGILAEELREIVIDMKIAGKLKYVTGMEDNVDWLHIDVRPCNRLNKIGLFVFDP